MKVLFVCTGNICRSPVAERMLQDWSEQRGMNIMVSSAGTRALNGRPMHPESQRVLRDRGLVPGEFRSRMLTSAIVAESDLILGMSREHRAFARQLVPARWKRMYALREIALGATTVNAGPSAAFRAVDPTAADLDIDDPIAQGPAVFDAAADEIAMSISAAVDWIADQYIAGLNDRHCAQ